MVDDQVACDSRNDDKIANMAYQSKKYLHSTIPVIKNTIKKKTELHGNNQKCSRTKTQSKNSKGNK